MKHALRFLLMAGWLPLLGFAQTFVVSQPDCIIFFHFTATGQTSPTSPNAGLDNRTTGCTTWSLSYTSVTFTGATVTLQSAPNTSTGVAGTWVTFAGATAILNSNPLTISGTPSQGFFSLLGYNPWVRVLFTVTSGPAAGTVDGAAFGWRIPSAGTSSGATSNVNIVGPLGQALMAASIPVVIASNQSAVPVTFTPSGTQNVNLTQIDGAAAVTGGVAGSLGVGGLAAAGAAIAGNPNMIGGKDAVGNAEVLHVDPPGNLFQYLGCASQATVALSGTSYTQIVAASGSTVIRICKVLVTSVSGGSPVVNTFSGAFGVCGSSPTQVFLAGGITGIDSDFGGSLKSAAGVAFCVSESTSNSDIVTVTYTQN